MKLLLVVVLVTVFARCGVHAGIMSEAGLGSVPGDPGAGALPGDPGADVPPGDLGTVPLPGDPGADPGAGALPGDPGAGGFPGDPAGFLPGPGDIVIGPQPDGSVILNGPVDGTADSGFMGGTGMAAGMDPGAVDMGPGADVGVGAGAGAGGAVDPGTAAGGVDAMPWAADSGQGGAVRPGVIDFGTGPGAGVAAGRPAGVGFGAAGGPGAGVGPGVGAGVGPGVGAGVGPGVRAGVGPGVGAGVGPGVGAGVGVGPGVGAGAGIRAGIGAAVGRVLSGMGAAGGPGQPRAPGEAAMPAEAGLQEPISPEQAALNAKCAARCTSRSCLIAHEEDCRMYVVCEPFADGYHGTVQPCPHGTFWSGSNQVLSLTETTCALPKDVQCPRDPCSVPTNEGGAYFHPGSCKKYWRCEGGISVPKCCPGYERYNRQTGECEYQRGGPCFPEDCTLVADICANFEHQSEPMNDRSCGTYWACQAGNPVPACCPAGQRYSVFQRACINDPTRPCTDQCPAHYMTDSNTHPCAAGVQTFKLNDGRCRTYLECLQGEQPGSYVIQRRCCKSEFEYDPTQNTCVRSRGPADCLPGCPMYYATDCHLKPVPGNPAAYVTAAHDVETVMPCSPGTVFSQEKCGCGTYVEGAPDNSCTIQVDLQFHWPQFKNYGSEPMVNIQQQGTAAEGSILNGQSTYHYDQNLIFKIDYLKQALNELYLHIDYLPESAAVGDKMVLVSNCKQATTGPNQPAGEPSLEVTLENGFVVFRAQTPTDSIEQRVRYKPNIWNQFKAFYDKANVLISNQAADMPEPRTKTGPLNGAINVAEEGLEIGSCEAMTQRVGFLGDIAKVAASKCLSQDQKDFVLSHIIRGQADQGQGSNQGSGPNPEPEPLLGK